MATENERDMNDFAGGFGDERAAAPGDDEAFGGSDAGGTGGMDLDAAAHNDGVKPDAEGEGKPAAVVAVVAPAGDGKSGPDSEPIARQPEGGEAGAGSAADNGEGGNAAGTGEGDAGGIVIAVAGGEGGDSPIGGANPASPDAAADDEPSNEADKQRQRSWEGRLKAREAELNELAKKLEAKGASEGADPGEATGDALEAVADKTTNPEMASAANDLAEQVESGAISPEDAMAQLKEDFGEPFVKLIETVATAAAGKALEGMRKDVDALRGDTEEVVTHLKNEADRRHFEELSKAYPDFNEINKSPEFEGFIDSLPPDEKADAERVRAGGSTAEVIALIKSFKDQGSATNDSPAAGVQEPAAAEPATAAVPPTAGPSDDEIDSASAVRGGGMQLPTEPAGDDDFAGGWNDTPDVKGRG